MAWWVYLLGALVLLLANIKCYYQVIGITGNARNEKNKKDNKDKKKLLIFLLFLDSAVIITIILKSCNII